MFVAVMKQVSTVGNENILFCRKAQNVYQKKIEVLNRPTFPSIFLTRLFHTLGYLRFRASNNAIKNVIELYKEALTSS